MSSRRVAGAGDGKAPLDVLLVSLGGTLGLRVADQQLAGALAAAGLEVQVAAAELPREVRTLMLTDLVQARAAARAAREALAERRARHVIYSTTTAALLWPVPGMIRFDTLAQVTRPGHDGWWQRPLELRRLRQSPLLLPWDAASLDGAPASVRGAEALVVPVSVEAASGAAPPAGAGPGARSGEAEAQREARAVLDGAERAGSGRVVALTYAADPVKKGLDRVLAAWAAARTGGELLLVTGRPALPEGYGPPEGVVCAARMSASAFAAAAGMVGVYVTAPRREDYGIAQLEAMASGARVVTTAAPGPYAALALLRAEWPQQVIEAADDTAALASALRGAIDGPLSDGERAQLSASLAPWSRARVEQLVREQLAPRLAAG